MVRDALGSQDDLMDGGGRTYDDGELRGSLGGRRHKRPDPPQTLEPEPRSPPAATKELTREERRLRVLLIVHAIVSALLACGYIIVGQTADITALPNSFSKDVVFVALSVLAAADVRRRGWLSLVLALAYLALAGGQLATLLRGGAPDLDLGVIELPAAAALFAWMSVDIGLAVLFMGWWTAAERAAKGLRYLHPVGFAALVSLAEVLIEGRREVLSPEDVAHNVDRYLDTLEAHGRGRVQFALIVVALWPMLTGRPPLPSLAPETRKRFLERRFIDEEARRRMPRPVRRGLQAAIRIASQLAYLGYYGDSRTWRSIGYKRYCDRDHARPPPAAGNGSPLRSLSDLPRRVAEGYETIVIGSGAAGGILANRFADAGRRVLVVERGPHVEKFSDDEVEQYLRLYNEGALQLATTFDLQVLQGMCVGGGTTINNGLCMCPPSAVLDDWTAHGIDRPGLEAAIKQVRDWLDVQPIREEVTTKAARRFGAAVERMALPGRLEVMEANITQACRGCGYCNLGCQFGAKQSTLDTVLPWAQRGHGGNLEVLADFRVECITHHGARAHAVSGRHRSGERAEIPANEIVVAAGALGSSSLLQRSGIGGKHVGQGLHFNLTSPLTAEFPDEVDSFDGIQMSHAFVAGGEVPDYLIETWFNPPATQALAMPGWFNRHFENMNRYRQMASAGVLVGTSTPSRVKRSRAENRFTREIAPCDSERILTGLEVAGQIFLEAGATRVMPATFAYREYTEANLTGLRESVRRSDDLLLTSAHPQGGNAMDKVVDDGFRVHGMENLYLCDASVFPSSVCVNPQLTVMGMALYAAQRILDDDPP